MTELPPFQPPSLQGWFFCTRFRDLENGFFFQLFFSFFSAFSQPQQFRQRIYPTERGHGFLNVRTAAQLESKQQSHRVFAFFRQVRDLCIKGHDSEAALNRSAPLSQWRP